VPAAPATLEAATVVQSDPPWAKDIDDGAVISLAEAMDRVKKQRPAALDELVAGVGERAPTMLVDEDLRIVERGDDTATLVAEAERLDQVAHVEEAQKREFVLPPLNLLDYDAPALEPIDEGKLRTQADKLVAKFMDFGIEGRVREIRPGPVVTTYEFVPAPGIKVSKIAALSDDIAMAMEAVHVRIVAPIPGKGAVGIEIPNEKRETVYMMEIIADPAFKKKDDKLMMALGKDIEGKSYYANLADMPHVLISGTTGSGKSVSVNAMICSILYRAAPEDVRFMMIDPKMLELSLYDGIPHLLLPPIIDSKKAAVALKWCVAEMERRYQLLSDQGVRDIKGFNDKVAAADAIDDTDPETVRAGLRDKDGKRLTKMPFIVVIIDEYADLIAVAGKDVEGYVMRIAQKARAAGIHVMLATQRPSVDVITGVIKANFPVRMGFRLASSHDSKTIINQPGAEKLLGRGDMLFMPPGTSNVLRVHGAFISEKELHRVVDYLKTQGTPDYNMDILTYQEEGEDGGVSAEELANEPKDARYDEAMQLVARTKKCSTSYVQRMLNIGYQRAARIVDRMEREGLVGPALNTKGDRDIYLRPDGSVDASQRVNM
jgi:S-DNA-T family DNA segregation ATPase FtsK/SpoIIIE